MSARADLCGGRSAMIVPTATSVSVRDTHRRAFNLPGSGRVTGNSHLTGRLRIRIGQEGLADGLLTSCRRSVRSSRMGLASRLNE